ncbi:phospholipase D-like domain-containing protein [Verrucomicrobium sp. BvORR106]|uniref:phospholipase D-like domain-containing protein n=1 Tax=Verrucomicrobium sp. BvORR106 TaxID=1403819 RepID=UPI00068DB3DD|nr:phospholipase D-like domain-containing protein [Verrucomicrobium sp. BvORR106]
MRKKATHDGLTVHAVAGTYVVLLTFTLGEADCPGLKGFAIHRTDHTDQEAGWLQGMKVFRATDPGLAPGMKHSTRLQPIQDFWWSDYTAKAGHKYTYKVVALKGDPQNLIPHAEVSVTLHAESTEGEEHGIYFNRGATASQEYSRRFGKLRPPEDNMAHPVWGWLSRGAHEAIIDFIGRAQGDTWGIRVGAYEFRLPSVSDALDKARDLGADVKILFDAGKEFPREENRAEAVRAKIKGLCKERVPKPAALSHNKFIVLLKKGKAVAVLLGSTNFSLGGVYGQSNVVHTVENSDIAAAYLDYWEQLSKNPEKAVLAPYLTENYPAPSAPHPSRA